MKQHRRFLAASLIAVAAVTLCSGQLLAQDEMETGGMGMGEMMGGHGQSARMMAFQPRHILHHGDVLNLTDEQREALMGMQHEAMQAHAAAKETHDARLAELTALFGESVDVDQARELFASAHAAGGEAHWAQINAAIEAMGVLTETQRVRVQGWADMMDMMGRMRMMEGHDRDGMMRGGDDEDEDEMHERGEMRRGT